MLVADYDRIRQGNAGRCDPRSLTRQLSLVLNGENPPTPHPPMDCRAHLHADHELNASPLLRASSQQRFRYPLPHHRRDWRAQGPLHGGANEAVMHLLFEIDKKGEDPVEHVKACCGEKRRSPASDSRLHTEDPRATHLRKMSRRSASPPTTPVVRHVTRHREVHQRGKEADANVDFYSASTYTTLASISISSLPSSL